jgi:hypothetical protein
MRIAIIIMALLFSTSAIAQDIGQQWFSAMKRGSGNKAAKVTVKTGLRYGNDGQDSVIKDKVAKHLSKVFRKIRRKFRKAEIQKLPCSTVGRELGHMSQEWKDKSESMSVWIRRIPEDFCGGNRIKPPDVWLIKLLSDDLPHAIILFDNQEDEELINGFYHF